jgi:caffeoyl-CoA O-methyltransferase
MDQELFHSIDRYLNDLFVPQDEALEAAVQALEDEEMPKIQVAPNQGKLLYVLALLCNARNILEIGTLSGYSAIWMARALPPEGRLITLEYDARHAAIAEQVIERAGLAKQVQVRVGAALDVLPQLEAESAGPFDMVFIDADKPPYLEYFEWSLRLARPGALIVADNVIRRGKVLDAASSDDAALQGIDRFNRALAQHPAVAATIVQTVGTKGHDGLSLAVVRR